MGEGVSREARTRSPTLPPFATRRACPERSRGGGPPAKRSPGPRDSTYFTTRRVGQPAVFHDKTLRVIPVPLLQRACRGRRRRLKGTPNRWNLPRKKHRVAQAVIYLQCGQQRAQIQRGIVVIGTALWGDRTSAVPLGRECANIFRSGCSRGNQHRLLER